LAGTLPDQIRKLSKLKKLSASYNKLKGTIPPSVNELKKLDLFHLHGNQLKGNADLFDKEDIPKSLSLIAEARTYLKNWLNRYRISHGK